MNAAAKQAPLVGRTQWMLDSERRPGIMLRGPSKATKCFIGILFYELDRKERGDLVCHTFVSELSFFCCSRNGRWSEMIKDGSTSCLKLNEWRPETALVRYKITA